VESSQASTCPGEKLEGQKTGGSEGQGLFRERRPSSDRGGFEVAVRVHQGQATSRVSVSSRKLGAVG